MCVCYDGWLSSCTGIRKNWDKEEATHQRDPNQYVTFVADAIGSSVSAANSFIIVGGMRDYGSGRAAHKQRHVNPGAP